jgi:hypothetical protein
MILMEGMPLMRDDLNKGMPLIGGFFLFFFLIKRTKNHGGFLDDGLVNELRYV